MPVIRLRTVYEDDRPWVARVLKERWHSTQIVTHGQIHQAERLPGFVAEVHDERVGLVTYRIDGRECQVVTLNSLRAGIGVGSTLLGAAREAARVADCRRIWLVTTNDNLAALRFYQRRGWRLAAIHRDALDTSRRLKPEIPRIGLDGIPLRDEIELEILL